MSNKFENEELDAIIQALGQAIEADEQRTGILSPERLQQMEGAYRLLLELAKETDAVVTYQLNAPFKSMGSICMEAESFEFTDIPKLIKAIHTSDNIDIYPLTNGHIRMVLTFHGLVKAI
ncbi:MAG: hypothetical protein IJO21_03030 [Oscillospiraceae bacterium]|nr:hypothetical protein [Oscillospiraceae bacterium]MBQ7130001.1 hypothetical protein [Oscillospiraceae bacterium]